MLRRRGAAGRQRLLRHRIVDWYGDGARHEALLAGWRAACVDAGATWGGGESPSLPALVATDEIELAGSAVGIVPDGRPPILGADAYPRRRDRDRGQQRPCTPTAPRWRGGSPTQLPEGYRTPLTSGRTFGEALLDRTVIYVPLVRALLSSAVEVHYLSHITGHGLLKLMRPRRELGYTDRRASRRARGARVPRRAAPGMSPAAGLLDVQHGVRASRSTARPEPARRSSGLAAGLGLTAQVAGVVEDGPRRVVLSEIDVVFESDDMDLTPRLA